MHLCTSLIKLTPIHLNVKGFTPNITELCFSFLFLLQINDQNFTPISLLYN